MKFSPLFRGSFYTYDSEEEPVAIRRSLIPIPGRESFTVTFSNVVKKNAFLFSMRGWDNAHIYMWIMKDYAWASQNHTLALIFGSAALSWCAVLFTHAIHNRDWEETYFLVGMFLWLFANFWWMAGETEITGDDDTNSLQSSFIMEAALSWLVLYFFVLMPLNIFKENFAMKKYFEDAGMVSRFKFFRNWRQYEYVHMLCWCMKDFAWNRMIAPLWIVALIPTVLVGADFIYETYSKNYIIDFAHYSAQLLWVFGNAAWSAGELFNAAYDEPIPVTNASYDSVRTGRWWACILLLLAYVPILCLYFGWVPYIILGALKERYQKEEDVLNAAESQAHNAEFNPALSDGRSSFASTSGSYNPSGAQTLSSVLASLNTPPQKSSRSYGAESEVLAAISEETSVAGSYEQRGMPSPPSFVDSPPVSRKPTKDVTDLKVSQTSPLFRSSTGIESEVAGVDQDGSTDASPLLETGSLSSLAGASPSSVATHAAAPPQIGPSQTSPGQP
jgi:hypothetical protein